MLHQNDGALRRRIICGANDAEMEQIVAIIISWGGYDLVCANGEHIDALMDGIMTEESAYASPLVPGKNDVWIECAPEAGGVAAIKAAGGMYIGHHRPGDPGYKTDLDSPEAAFCASSIGQVLQRLWGLRDDEVLATQVDQEVLAIGEADHALAWHMAGKGLLSRGMAQVLYRMRMPANERLRVDGAIYAFVTNAPYLQDCRLFSGKSANILPLRRMYEVRDLTDMQNGTLGDVYVQDILHHVAAIMGMAYLRRDEVWEGDTLKTKVIQYTLVGSGVGSSTEVVGWWPMFAALGVSESTYSYNPLTGIAVGRVLPEEQAAVAEGHDAPSQVSTLIAA